MNDAPRPPEAHCPLERFRSALQEPARVQSRVLRAILRRNADCEFGRRFGFAGIVGPAQFAARVPVSTYDDLQPAIERMAHGDPAVLTAEAVCAWEVTGGSSGGAKLVPYTASGLDEFRAGLQPWLAALRAWRPSAFAGRAYWSISPAARRPATTPSGQAIGMPSDAAYFGESLGREIASTLAVPAEVGRLTDVDAWRRATLLHLVACEDLALVSVWSPTFLLELLRHLVRDARAVADEVCRAAGGATGMSGSPAHLRRRAELLLDVAAGPSPEWSRLWPRLALLSCWDHAAAGPHAQALRAAFPGVALQGKGLLATEGLVTVPVECGADPVLALESGFFEFVDAAGVARMAHELEPQREYDLLMTTSSGLYRYAIGDRVRVTGHVGATPALRFVGRSGVVSDLCGEKLDETFVASALASLNVRFALLLPRLAPPGYVLVLDAAELPRHAAVDAARRADAALCANPQYAYARRLGQLAAVEAAPVEAPVGAWMARGERRGQRLGDIKLPALCVQADAAGAFGIVP